MSLSKTQRKLLWAVPAGLCVIAVCSIGLMAAAGESSGSNDHVLPSQVNQDPVGYTLDHVTIVHRHGIRAPTHLSNWSNPHDYAMGLGFLTAKGKQGSVSVGKIFRLFYGQFLSSSPREVWARSSTYKRCFETLQLLLGAMYPPRGLWDFGFPVQPIPITMVPEGNDVLIESCTVKSAPDFKYMVNETNEALKHDGFATVGDFFNWLTKVSGYDASTSDFYEPIIDALYAQKFNGLAIPDWAVEKNESMDWAMRRLSFEFWRSSIPFYGQYMSKTIAERTNGSATGSVKERISIMSYHDTTIQAILKALKLDNVQLYPSFLAALHFQLYTRNADGAKFVRTLYHQGFTANGHYREAVELELPDCPFPDCPVNKFVNIMNSFYNDIDRSDCAPVNKKALL